MRKKLIGTLLTLCMITGGSIAQSSIATAQANPAAVKVQVDGWLVDFPDAQPFVDAKTSRTLVPVRFVAEQLRAEVDWNQQQRMVTIKKDDKTITLRIGERVAHVNGETVSFDANAIVKDDRTFVPLRFISKSFGASVNWLQDQRLVDIDTTGQTPETTQPTTPAPVPPTTTGDMLPMPSSDGVVPPPDWFGRDATNDVEDADMKGDYGGCLFCDPDKVVP